MDPDLLQGCNTSQSPRETDASFDAGSTVDMQQHESVDTYLTEDASHSKPPPANETDSVAWASDSGHQDLYQSSSFVIHRLVFVPYVRIFLRRLYPVFPVVDREALLALLEPEEHEERPIPVGMYGFLAALSAAVIVQLNVADLGALETESSMFGGEAADSRWDVNSQLPFSAQFFVAQCMQARQQQDFVEEPDEWTILTSFFLFAYYGNMDQSRSAWYYLREAIGFVQALRLDEEDSYFGVDTETEQRRRRLFWLLLVTERAYAIQHRRRAVLRPTIDLPRVFDSQDPKLAYGFVTLAKLFAAVDEAFIAAWTDHPALVGAGMSKQSSQSIAKLLRQDDVAGVLSVSEIDETQRLDILITQQWLRILACQLQKEIPPQSTSSRDGHVPCLQDGLRGNTHRILDTSRSLLAIISSATPTTLESHGIGMEQKISDVANCLCDLLAELDTNEFYNPLFSAPECLHNFMVFLAGFRHHESQYLPPLAQKASSVLAVRLQPTAFPAAAEEGGGMSESVEWRRSEYMNEDVIL